MLWSKVGRTNKVYLGLNGLFRASDAEVYEFSGEQVSSLTALVCDDYSLYYGFSDVIFSVVDSYEGDSVSVISSSEINTVPSIRHAFTGTIPSDSIISGLSKNIRRGGGYTVSCASAVFTYAEVYEILNEIKVSSPKAIFLTASDIIYITSTGIYRYDKNTLTLEAYASVSGITSGVVNNYGAYLGTSSGVYFITTANLLLTGDRTSDLILKFTTGTTPSVQSNLINSLGGSGNLLIIGSSLGIDFLPDSNLTTVYRLTTANVTKCSAKGLYIGYIVAGIAYVHGLPSANFTLSSTNISGVDPVIAYNRQAPSTVYTTTWYDLAGTNGSHFVQSPTGSNEVYVYRIEANYSLTLTQTIVLPVDFSNRGTICYGDYMFIDCKNYANTGSYLYVYKRSGDTFSSIFLQSSTVTEHGGFCGLNPQGTVFIRKTTLAGTVGSDKFKIYDRYTRSTDTITGPSQYWYPYDFSFQAWSVDGTYLIGTGSLDGQSASKILVFSNNTEMPSLSGTANNYDVALPATIITYSASRLITIEHAGGSEYPVYMCVYSISGSVVTFISKIMVGMNRSVAAAERYDYYIQMLNGYIILGKYTRNDAYQYIAPMTTTAYTIENDELIEAGIGAYLESVNSACNFGEIYTEGTRAVTLVGDYILSPYASQGLQLNILDATSTVEQAYTVANDIVIEKDAFIATEEGIIVEPQHNKLVKRLIKDSFGGSNKVKTIFPSPIAGRFLGSVAYGTDDGSGSGHIGVFNLED